MPYTIREAEDTEKLETANLIHKHHAPDAVMNQGFILQNKYSAQEERIIEDSVTSFVKSNVCLVAADNEDGKIIAAMVLDPFDIPRPKLRAKPTNVAEEFRECVWNIYIDSRLYERYPNVEKCLRLRCLCVQKEHRGKGLAKILVKESVDWAKKNDVQVVYGLFTSPASAKAAKNVGFVQHVNYDLNSAKDFDGRSAFGDVSPNNMAPVMALDLRNL